MSASHGHGKGKKHKKPKHDEKPSELEKPLEKRVRKLGLEVEILAVIVAVAIIAVIYLLSTDIPLFTQSQQEVVPEDKDDCLSLNPTMTEENCRDLMYHDRAISENNRELCGMIKANITREHCIKYFR